MYSLKKNQDLIEKVKSFGDISNHQLLCLEHINRIVSVLNVNFYSETSIY